MIFRLLSEFQIKGHNKIKEVVKKLSNDLIKFVEPDFVFSDDRGSLTQLSRGGWNQVNSIISEAGAFRGNHYHKENREYFYVVDGEFLLTLKKDGLLQEYKISSKDCFIIESYVIHSFAYKKRTILVTMYDIGVEMSNGEKDIYVE